MIFEKNLDFDKRYMYTGPVSRLGYMLKPLNFRHFFAKTIRYVKKHGKYCE